MMVLLVVTVCGVLSVTFLAAQSTSIGLAHNIQRRGQAAHIAESAVALGMGYIRNNADWRDRLTNGSWVSAAPLMGGTFDLSIRDGLDLDGDGAVDGDADLKDDPRDPFTLKITASRDGFARSITTEVTPIDPATIRVAMVVVNANNLTAEEQARRDLLESWNWEVRIFDDDASDTAFANEVRAGADVLYVTGGVSPRKLSWAQGRLAVGLAWEKGRLCRTFRLSTSNSTFSDDGADIVTTGYPITEAFGAGVLRLVAGAATIEHPAGTLAPSAIVLATRSGVPTTPALVMLEKGGTLTGARIAADRRVALPFAAMPTGSLTDDGKNLLKAALLWAGQSDLAALSLLINGGFESSTSDGDSLIDPGWKEYEARYVQLSDKTTGMVHGGVYSAKFDAVFQGGDGQQMLQRVTNLAPNKDYDVTAYVRMTAIDSKGWAGSGLQISAAHGELGATVTGHVQNVVTSDWKKATFTAAASDQGELWVRANWYGVNSGVCYLDDVTLVDPVKAAGEFEYEVQWRE